MNKEKRLSAYRGQKAKSSVITVGDGRGFVVIDKRENRFVITAAHCLPHLPPGHCSSHVEEQIYPNLLGPLGNKHTVWAECFFVDPIADIAVLGCPDNQRFFDEADAYDALMISATPIRIAAAPVKGPAWLLSLEGKWFHCIVEYINRIDGPLFICKTAQPIMGGMSGSPVISADGAAIGIVSLSSNAEGFFGQPDGCEDENGMPNPRLLRDLPGWMLRGTNR
jgi:hypothetical protein